MGHMEREHVTHEVGDKDAWICVCGNQPSDDGFYSCDRRGKQVVPDKDWIEPLYVCDACGRIIDGDTLKVLGKRENEEAAI